MFWRCANDLFGYCAKKPDDMSEVQHITNMIDGKDVIIHTIGAKCSKQPSDCKSYQTMTQAYAGLVSDTPAEVVKAKRKKKSDAV